MPRPPSPLEPRPLTIGLPSFRGMGISFFNPPIDPPLPSPWAAARASPERRAGLFLEEPTASLGESPRKSAGKTAPLKPSSLNAILWLLSSRLRLLLMARPRRRRGGTRGPSRLPAHSNFDFDVPQAQRNLLVTLWRHRCMSMSVASGPDTRGSGHGTRKETKWWCLGKVI